VLSLLSAAGAKQPLVRFVDDAQWLDQASAQTLALVARRLFADPVGLLFASREQSDVFGGLPELVLEGLRNGDARALLGSGIRFVLDERYETGSSPRPAGILWRCLSRREDSRRRLAQLVRRSSRLGLFRQPR
jgi:hypothetical protein